jgi:PAS domain S-box-containing protein
MNTIALIDLAAFLAVCGAIVVFGIKTCRHRLLEHKSFLILVLLLASMLFYLSLAMEWLWQQSIFSKAENFVSVLLPVFWSFVFYGIQQEKWKSDLIQSEQFHREFIENQPMGLCRTTIENGGRFIVANTAMARMLGYESAGQLMESKAVALYHHPGDRDRLLDRLIKNERLNGFEINGKKRDGTEVFLSMTMRLIRSDDGTPLEIECTIEDITARKKVELALQEREQLHRQAQRIAKLGHWQVFADSRALVFSEEMYRILEVDNGKSGGSPEALFERIHPDDRTPVNSKINQAMQNGSKISFVHRLLLPDGREKYIHTMAHAEYGVNDKPVRLIGTSQDVTQLKLAEIEREKTEHRLLQAQKLEAIGTLAGGIAHDFNNILSSILGFTELSLHELPRTARPPRNSKSCCRAACERGIW